MSLKYRPARNTYCCRNKWNENLYRARRAKIRPVPETFQRRDDGLCAICKEAPATEFDHCHKTNIPRGMLCRHCNLGLGHFKDNIESLLAAIAYLS